MSEQLEFVRVQGPVKWFDNDRGYGFIETETHGDVLLHAKVLRSSGFPPNVAESALVTCECIEVEGRKRATRVTAIDNGAIQARRVEDVASELGRLYDVDVSPAELRHAIETCRLRLEPALPVSHD